ncbi:MAG TPA: hypothetical protein VNX22_03890 [Acidobacteriaceae bacterium]|nr:hypothetical protein [Acidobacteriaceae bacterium]
MANVTILFGLLLVLLGLIGYIATGSQHTTALIPAGFGLLIGFCGLVARKPGRRKLFMHIAVTLGLLGFLGTVSSIYKMFQIAQHQVVARHAAVYAQFIMCLLCLVFVVLCVRSFIAARGTPTA